MTGDTSARRYIVHGRVQGVAFRWFTARAAEAAGIRGWVRNRDDGTVEAQVWADEVGQRAFLEAVNKGPPAARVEKVDVEEAAGESPRRFEIRR